MAFPYVPNYGGNWQDGAGGGTPITEAALDNLETQFASVIALLTTRGDIIYRGAATWERLVAGAAGTILEMGANDPAWGAAPARMTIAETEVYSAATPGASAWTDLDLSAVVGANLALVVLKVTAGNNCQWAFRKNGDADEFYSAGVVMVGCAKAYTTVGLFDVVLVATDATGIIEWEASAGVANATIDVMAYIK